MACVDKNSPTTSAKSLSIKSSTLPSAVRRIDLSHYRNELLLSEMRRTFIAVNLLVYNHIMYLYTHYLRNADLCVLIVTTAQPGTR